MSSLTPFCLRLPCHYGPHCVVSECLYRYTHAGLWNGAVLCAAGFATLGLRRVLGAGTCFASSTSSLTRSGSARSSRPGIFLISPTKNCLFVIYVLHTPGDFNASI
jgi:hypothetical protein